MTIYYYDLEIYKKPTKSWSRDRFKIEEKQILAENDRYIVFDDPYFTKIEKTGDGFCWGKLNKPVIYFKSCLGGQGIFYRLYSDVKTRTTTIEKQIRQKANDEFGYLFSKNMDLSILKEPEKTP